MDPERRIPLEHPAGASLGRSAEGNGLTQEMVRKGDYLVPKRTLEAAEQSFEKRSARSRRVDKTLRAPLTTNLEFWKRNQRGYDYPGVDTPTDSPRFAITDHPDPRERRRIAGEKEGPARLSPRKRTTTLIEDFDELADRPIQMPRLGDLIPREYL